MRHFGLKVRMAIVGSILFAFYAIAILAAVAIWGTSVFPLAILGSVLLVGFQYKVGKWAALRSVGAEDMPENGQYQHVHRMVEDLSRDMGIEKPRLMAANMGVPNAFAVGRKGAGVVVVSTELMSMLDDDELEGVIAHELSHIANRDVVTMVVGQGIASVVGIVAQWAVLLTGDNELADFFLAMIVGQIVQMIAMIFVLAISRYREFVADADAKRAIGSGDPLARALEKIQRGNQAVQEDRSQVDEQVSALCIFGEDRSLIQKLFSTHPPTEERIQRLRE